MARLHENLVQGSVDDNPLAIGATTLNSAAGLPLMSAVTAPTTSVIVLDPQRVYGNPEIVIVTAHTSSATSATITRGQVGTSARGHPQGTAWAHAALKDDLAFLDVANTFTATNQYFGPNAAGGSGAALHINADTDQTVLLEAISSGANAALILQTKGTDNLSLKTGGVLDVTRLDATSLLRVSQTVTSGSTAIGILRYHNGTAETTSVVTVGSADSAGSGYRVLRVAN